MATSYAIVSAEEAKAEYNSDQIEGLALLNEIRAKVGVPLVQLDPNITRAAILHATYYNMNGENPSIYAHDEIEGKPGFHGKTILDRMRAAGWQDPKYGYAYGEVMHFNSKSTADAIKSWLNTAYHRAILLSPDFDVVGIGLVDGTTVLDFGNAENDHKTRNGIVVYPYDDMRDAPVGFYGLEIPNPLDRFSAKFSGGIISVITEDPMINHSVKITDELGNSVPFYEEEQGGKELFFYPKSVLKGHSTYTVTFQYQLENYQSKTKVWSFTTGAGTALKKISFSSTELVVAEGDELPFQILGAFSDGTTSALTEGIDLKYTDGIKISSDVIKGVKPGIWEIGVTKDNITYKQNVKVIPKINYDTSENLNASTDLSDISNHWASQSILWAIQSGIASGYNDHTFRPDANISEAEFLAMLLRMFQVNISTNDSQHWADVAYRISNDRNYPLLGITNIPLRETKISRLQVAELIAAIDGYNYKDNYAVWYIMAKGYSKGKIGYSVEGYKALDLLTRAEAIQFLQNIKPLLKELKYRPNQPTPLTMLPQWPEDKNQLISDKMMISKFNSDHSLDIEGLFAGHKNETLTISVQTGGSSPKQIEDVNVQIDSNGHFQIHAGVYQQQSLNIYLRANEAVYWISVDVNSEKRSKY
ncbi:CAP and S-layer homology domain-containing protein [Paenibacillus silvestris]|nr:S-layer homology domain-containing protein [Paenibacillus silvestris]